MSARSHLVGAMVAGLATVLQGALAGAAAAPLDVVLAAVAAEEAAPAVRVRLLVKRGDVSDVYYIDRLRPGRLHVLKNPRQDGLEMIVIDGRQWLRTAAGWRPQPAPPQPSAEFLPSLTEMLKGGLTEGVEVAAPGGGRVIEGVMTWSAPTTCKGKLRMVIDSSGRPGSVRFEGDCGGKASLFHQAMTYGGDFSIEPPL